MIVRRIALALLVASAIASTAPALAQPSDLPIPAVKSEKFPAGIAVRKTAAGPVLADRKGRTLYGMDMRTVLRWAPDAAQYCRDNCARDWEPVLAPAGAAVNIRFPGAPGRSRPDAAPDPDAASYLDNRTAPDWTVIAGPQGPQWVYKGWHMVYVRRGERPGSTAHDGADGLIWNTLKYVPMRPTVVAPPGVQPAFVDGRYILVDAAGRALFTGNCARECAGWTALAAPAASRGFGKWRVAEHADGAQWLLGKAPVYVDGDGDPATLPAGARYIAP